MKKRVLSMFMALALCLTLLPVSPAWAAEADAPEGGTIVQEEQQEKAPAAESPAILEKAAGNGIAAQNGGDSTVENAVAEVTSGGKTTQYARLPAALSAAKAGDTLTLLKDVTGDVTVIIDEAITFDLNGHEISNLQVKAKATIKDSTGGKGKISQKLTVTYDLTLGDLLEQDYAFQRNSDNTWVNGTDKSAENVTVQQAPITKVTLTVNGNSVALDEDNKGRFSVELGTDVTLTASCEGSMEAPYVTWSPSRGGEDGGTDNPVKQGTGKSLSYTLPPEDLTVGTHTYRVSFCSENPGSVGQVTGYYKVAQITITVEKIDLANAEVTIDPWLADGKFRFVPNASETVAFTFFSTITVTANGEKYKLSDGDYIYTGATATQVGNYTLTITAKDSCANFKGSKAIPWEVIPYTLHEPSFLGKQTYTKTYDGTTTLPEYTFRALFPGKGSDSEVDWREDKYKNNYEVTAAEFVSADAGENKPINQTITLKNENFVFAPTEMINIKGITTTDKTITYTNFTPIETYPTLETTFNIEKAPMPDFDKEVTLDIVNDLAHTYTIDLLALPPLESPRTYGDTQYEVDQSSVKELTQGYNAIQDVGFAVNPDNGKTQLTFHAPAVENQTEGSVGAIKITVTPTNYEPVTLAVNLRAVNKQRLGMFVFVATDPVVYGMTLGDIKLSAEATVDKQVIPGTIAWEDPLTTVPAAGRATYRWTFTPDDTMHYLTASNTITFLVDKATPTGAPTYTAITTGGKTLADAPLTPNASWPSGTVQWVDKDGKPLPASTQVQANTKYTWSFTPADAANYNGATGSVTLYAVSSGGGGSSSGGGSDRDNSGSTGKTETTTKPDGTTVKTETRADGTKIQTETKKDGSTVKTETKKDGSSVTENKAANGSTGTVKTDKNGQTTAETALSSKAIEDAKKSGEPVKAPVEVEATRNSNTAPTVKIELPRNSGDTKVEIPVSNVKPGTVAVLVHPDGTEEIVKNSLPTEDGIQLTVNGGATVKIVDNSKDFIDTRNHWAKDAIDFVSARGLVNGMSDSIYAPNASTTRAQLWTILARQNDADLTGGATWFENAQNWAKEKGISDGVNPDGTINRAQMVTMLWRAMGQPAAGGSASFADVPADSYYAQAVAWAIENGITAGVGGGRFDPNSTCTRAQIVTFLYRSYQSK